MRPINELEAAAAGTWFISMLGVHIGWRGKGVGSQLLGGRRVGKARDRCARRLALIVEDVNAGARRLYERHEYALRDQRPMGRIPGGSHGKDWLLMVKE